MNLNSGRNRATGSERSSRPWSASIMTAVLVTALVIEAIRKIVPAAMATVRPVAGLPTAARCATLPRPRDMNARPGDLLLVARLQEPRAGPPERRRAAPDLIGLRGGQALSRRQRPTGREDQETHRN